MPFDAGLLCDRVDLILWKGPFDPRSVRKISKHVGIPVVSLFETNDVTEELLFDTDYCYCYFFQNFMFMSVPDERFPNDIGELGGLRLITALR